MVVFINDILVYSKTREEHTIHLRIVLQTLRNYELCAKKEMSNFWMTKVKFLGHAVSQEGIYVHPAKIDAILLWQRPKQMMKICSFIKLARHYHNFVKNFSKIATELANLTRKDVRFE